MTTSSDLYRRLGFPFSSCSLSITRSSSDANLFKVKSEHVIVIGVLNASFRRWICSTSD